MIRLALGALRQHRGAYLGSFLAAVLAVALLAGAGLSLFSVLAAKPPANRFAAAAVVVSGDRAVTLRTVKHKKGKDKVKTKSERLTGAGTLQVELTGRVEALAGVARAVADYAFPVVLSPPAGRPLRGAAEAPVIAHGWASASLTPYTLRSGRPPSAGELVVDADLAARGRLAPGDVMTVTTRTGSRTLRIVGIAAPPGRRGLAAQAAIFLADDQVAAVSGLPGPTAICVLAEPGVAADVLAHAIRPVAVGARVRTGADRVGGDLPGALPDYVAPISLFGLMIGITAFAAIFVLTGTVALGIEQRLRDLALLRTAGATPGQLQRLIGLESAVLALLAAGPGLLLGVVMAHLVAARFRALGVVPPQFVTQTNVLVLLAAAFAGVAVTYGAARLASRRAARIAPTQALVETAVGPAGRTPVRTAIALIAAAGAGAVLTFVPLGGPLGMGMSFVASALLVCAIAAAGPALVRPLLAVVARAGALGGTAGRLAAAIARARPRRVAAVAVPLVLIFGLNAPMLLNSALLTQLTRAQEVARYAAATGQVVAPGGLPLDVVRQVVALPEVTGAAATFPTRVIVNEGGGKPKDYAAQGLLLSGRDPVLDLAVRQGTLTGAAPFAASTYLAEHEGWRVGDQVPVWLGDGYRLTLRLGAIFERSRGFGDLLLPAELVAAHDPRGLAGTVALRYKEDVAAAIRARWPGLRIVPPVGAVTSATRDQQGGFELLIVISLGFTAIAVVNTFAVSTAGRRREYADLRLAGATTDQLYRMAGGEATITVVVGLLLGVLLGAVVVGAFSVAQDGVLRVIVSFRLYSALVGGVACLGLAAGMLPIRFVQRRRALPAAPAEP